MNDEPVTKIYHDAPKYVLVELRIGVDDLETAEDLSALACSLNPQNQYLTAEKVLEWAVFRGLLSFLPDMFREMNDAGEISDEACEELTTHYENSDWETRNDITNLNIVWSK